MKISRSLPSDEPKFREFWGAAIAYQKANHLQLWPPYLEDRIGAEIRAGLHFSAFLPDDTLAGFFSLTMSDPLIWNQKEKGDAIYIHRMCVNPALKGQRLAAWVLAWAYGYAAGNGRRFIRMDTWADNPRLVDYYVACGFRLAGEHQIVGSVPGLPPHYKDVKLTLFENVVGI
jgi:GNAT superfamily N-acetyltransferase